MGKKILNVLGILAALVLSLILAVVLLCTPILGACGSLLQTSTLRSVFKEIDYAEILSESGGSTAIDPEVMTDLMETELMGEIMELYMDGMFDVLDGKAEAVQLDGETLKALCHEYIDELLPIIEGMIDLPVELTEEQLKMVILQVIEQNAGDLADDLPGLDELGLNREMIMAVQMLRRGTVLWGVIAAAVVLSVLILLFRFPRFKGFMWLGVVYLLMGGFNLLASVGLKMSFSELLGSAIPVSGSIGAALGGVLAGEMMKGTAVIAIFGVVFVIVFAVGRAVLKKKASKPMVENYAVYEGGVPDMVENPGVAETAATERRE